MTRTDRTRIGTSERHLSVAVALRDAYTGGRPVGSPRVTLADRPEQFTQNRSGYYVLTDLPEDRSSVTIEVDPGDQYLPEQRVLADAALADRPQVVAVDLLPSPAYPFPAGATLLRGAVREAADDGPGTRLPGVELTLRGAPPDEEARDETDVIGRGRSTDRGEYVVFLRSLTGDTVADHYDDGADGADDANDNGAGGRPDGAGGRPDGAGGRPDGRVVTVDGGRPVVRAYDPEADRETTTAVGVGVGRTTSLDVTF